MIWRCTGKKGPKTLFFSGLENFGIWSVNKQNSYMPCPTNPWVGGVLLVVTYHIQGKLRIGYIPNQSMGLWNSVGCDWSYPGLSSKKKSVNKSLKMHPIPLGMKCTGALWTGNGLFEHTSSFRDETYGNIKTSGYNLQGRIAGGHNVRGRKVQGCVILVLSTRLLCAVEPLTSRACNPLSADLVFYSLCHLSWRRLL
jgi:hypothetical protein